MKYSAVNGSTLTDEMAQMYGDRIETLIEEHNGEVTADILVAEAQSESSPLHDHFEWDDQIAAGKYRHQQANYLLRSINVVIKRADDQEDEVRAFHSVRVSGGTEPGERRVSVSVQRVMNDQELRQQIIAAALKQLEAWERKFHQYQEFSPVIRAIGKLRQKLQ